MKIDLGSGRQALEAEGYVHIDKWSGPHIEYVHDLEDGLPPFDDDSVDEIRAHHCLEHIRNLIPLVNDCWRVLKPGGVFHVYVPNAAHPEAAWSDPTHCRAFTLKTFWYFTHEGHAAYPYTDRLWKIHDGYPRLNGSDGDWWEIECVMSPIK